jgi:hypothetical protein
MSEPASLPTERGKVTRTNHDLLHLGEAGERMRIEIAAIERRVAELAEHGSVGYAGTARRNLSGPASEA